MLCAGLASYGNRQFIEVFRGINVHLPSVIILVFSHESPTHLKRLHKVAQVEAMEICIEAEVLLASHLDLPLSMKHTGTHLLEFILV